MVYNYNFYVIHHSKFVIKVIKQKAKTDFKDNM